MNDSTSTQAADLDAIFSALGDPTRRALLCQLAKGEASVAQLRAPFEMSQPAISKHLKVLENAGLITRATRGTSRPARLHAAHLSEALGWLEDFRKFWQGNFTQLDTLLASMPQQKED
ncbi:transcriptional regulator [Amylibacter marinus]|uniref:Transcriptional regulator n=1 Tax=Amylibacter marinus TaxID=1475483 RepID=A0ABQ5VYB0_9RHOB|nr:metalloregulator ArsR/SmtB family transcription factor [Amylibacter marinus]GLQ36231.1 transcriptional regulator [Amylibacter marinus]